MATLEQQVFAKQFIEFLNTKGFSAFYCEEEGFCDFISYRKEDVFCPDLYVYELNIKACFNNLLAYCEKSVSLAIKYGDF